MHIFYAYLNLMNVSIDFFIARRNIYISSIVFYIKSFSNQKVAKTKIT